MKLLIIAPEAYPIPSTKGTSVETCIYNIASELAKSHMVTVVSRRVKHLPLVSVRNNLRIIRVKVGAKGAYLINALRSVRGYHYDHIQVDNRPRFLPLVRKQFPHTPISLFVHSLNFVTPPKAVVSMVQSQLENADLVVVNSTSLKHRLCALYPTQERKFRVAHLGVSTSQFRPPTAAERVEARAAFGVNNSFTIAFVGRLIPLKGVPVLIRAAELVQKDVPSTRVLVAGSGKKAYVTTLKNLAKKSRVVPIRFTGPIPWHKMPKLYWAADCFVCPSQGHEAFGLVVLEALASGLPTVASRNGGIQEIITHQVDGLLVDGFSNPRQFARAISKIALDKALGVELGEQGRRTSVNRFSWLATGKSIHQLYFGGVPSGPSKAP